MLSKTRNKKAAKKFFKKLLYTKLRQVKYLNNSIVIDVIETLSENDSKRSITLCWQGYLRPK